MKKLKVALIVAGILVILVSCHLVGYMIRVVVVLNPEVDLKMITYFGVGTIGIASGIFVLLLQKRL